MSAKALVNTKLTDRYNNQKDYFDYSVVLLEFPKNYFRLSNDNYFSITSFCKNSKISCKNLSIYKNAKKPIIRTFEQY